MEYDPRDCRRYDGETAFERVVGKRLSEGSGLIHLADDSVEGPQPRYNLPGDVGVAMHRHSGRRRYAVTRTDRLVRFLERVSKYLELRKISSDKKDSYCATDRSSRRSDSSRKLVENILGTESIDPQGVFGSILPEKRRVH